MNKAVWSRLFFITSKLIDKILNLNVMNSFYLFLSKAISNKNITFILNNNAIPTIKIFTIHEQMGPK